MIFDSSIQPAFQTMGIKYTIILLLIGLILNSLILWFFSRKFKFKKRNYIDAFIVALVAAFGTFLFNFFTPQNIQIFLIPLYYLLDVILIRLVYSERWKKCFIVGLAWWISGMLIVFIISFILGFIILMFTFSST